MIPYPYSSKKRGRSPPCTLVFGTGWRAESCRYVQEAKVLQEWSELIHNSSKITLPTKTPIITRLQKIRFSTFCRFLALSFSASVDFWISLDPVCGCCLTSGAGDTFVLIMESSLAGGSGRGGWGVPFRTMGAKTETLSLDTATAGTSTGVNVGGTGCGICEDSERSCFCRIGSSADNSGSGEIDVSGESECFAFSRASSFWRFLRSMRASLWAFLIADFVSLVGPVGLNKPSHH